MKFTQTPPIRAKCIQTVTPPIRVKFGQPRPNWVKFGMLLMSSAALGQQQNREE